MNGFELYGDMINIYREADLQCNCKLNNLLKRINNKGALITAKELIRENPAEDGLETLIKFGKEELSLEKLILSDKYKNLFTEEDREICRERLREFKNKE